MENSSLFTPNSRLVQEIMEEKSVGPLPDTFFSDIRQLPLNAENIVENVSGLREDAHIAFIASDSHDSIKTRSIASSRE